jgi:hypothetical protein
MQAGEGEVGGGARGAVGVPAVAQLLADGAQLGVGHQVGEIQVNHNLLARLQRL